MLSFSFCIEFFIIFFSTNKYAVLFGMPLVHSVLVWMDIADLHAPVFSHVFCPCCVLLSALPSPSRRTRWRWLSPRGSCSAPSASSRSLTSRASRSTCASRWSTRTNTSPRAPPSPSSRSEVTQFAPLPQLVFARFVLLQAYRMPFYRGVLCGLRSS